MADGHEPRNPSAEQEDALLRKAFANVGKRQNPPQGKLDRWEAVFRAELGHKILARKQRRLYVGAGAAVVLMLVGIAQFMTPQSPVAPVVATVLADKNGNKLFSHREALPVYAGLEIKVGDALLTGPQGYLSLSYRGADIRLKADTSVRFHTAKLELMHGAVYVDTQNKSTMDRGDVVVSTDYGSFTHIGTQFLVQTNNDQVVAAVREGTIIGPNNTELSAARGARQIRIDVSGVVTNQRIDSHGGVWNWVTEAAPALESPHAKVHDVLYWATREFGMELRYQTPDAQIYAAETSLPAVGLTVDRVVGVVERTAPSIRIEQTTSQWLVAVAD